MEHEDVLDMRRICAERMRKEMNGVQAKQARRDLDGVQANVEDALRAVRRERALDPGIQKGQPGSPRSG